MFKGNYNRAKLKIIITYYIFKKDINNLLF